MGDFNSEPRDKDMADFIERDNLHDLINNTNDGPLPHTHTEGPRRIDYILADRHVRDAVIKSDSLGESDGLFSDHTLQWADFNIKRLLGCDRVVPLGGNTRKFLLVNAKQKHAFQDKLRELHAHHKVEEKILALEDAFRSLDDLDSLDFHRLVDAYQTLDKVLSEAMKSAAKHVKDLDKGYQFCPS